ncbi:hypothetical protein GCM10011611_03010 [Aliidongia dinghuensis]|uniref:Uncharacterized protein n=1 Tax=Aliidongia dinghuensis TaxID=1867774 RepID=A0A8J3E2R7_9PROT|nr:hypothetical protein [Aliidongia dinghuensis]GGF00838.1 hypothetical protein GCM10011611_03010 [Aliidongia dinghuensis]
MGLAIREISREQDSKTFSLRIQWVLSAPHLNGLLVQRVERAGNQLISPGNISKDLSLYWEAWKVISGVVHGVDVSTKQPMAIPDRASHDTFSGEAKGFGATRIQAVVFWIDQTSGDCDTVLSRMPAGGVEYAGSLWSTDKDPFSYVVPSQLMTRDEFFMNEAF